MGKVKNLLIEIEEKVFPFTFAEDVTGRFVRPDEFETEAIIDELSKEYPRDFVRKAVENVFNEIYS